MRNLEHGIRNPFYVIQNPLLPMESRSHDGGFSWNPSIQVNLSRVSHYSGSGILDTGSEIRGLGSGIRQPPWLQEQSNRVMRSRHKTVTG